MRINKRNKLIFALTLLGAAACVTVNMPPTAPAHEPASAPASAPEALAYCWHDPKTGTLTSAPAYPASVRFQCVQGGPELRMLVTIAATEMAQQAAPASAPAGGKK